MRAAPRRLVGAEAARERFGARVDTLAEYLWRADPAADALVEAFAGLPTGEGHRLLTLALEQGLAAVPSPPPALRAFLEPLEATPVWLDPAELDRGGAALLRTGIFGLFALGAGALPRTYAPPAMNKPLAFSRRLVEVAPGRLFNTMSFHLATCEPGGLRRHGRGFAQSVHVRLAHARTRRQLLASGRWDADEWGAPLNQVDLAFVNVLFSAYPLAWLRRLGFRFSAEESEAVMQLWRYSGHLLGVDPALQAATEAEAHRYGALFEATQGPPDDDARALTAALMDAAPTIFRRVSDDARWVRDVWCVVARHLLGDPLGDGLGIPRPRLRHALPVLRLSVMQTELSRRLTPGGDAVAMRVGSGFVRHLLESKEALTARR